MFLSSSSNGLSSPSQGQDNDETASQPALEVTNESDDEVDSPVMPRSDSSPATALFGLPSPSTGVKPFSSVEELKRDNWAHATMKYRPTAMALLSKRAYYTVLSLIATDWNFDSQSG